MEPITPGPSPEGRGELRNPRLAALRAQKAALLPRAAALAAEGRSYLEIAAALGIAKSTVCNWLRDRPLGRAAARSLGTPRMTARLAARYESVYHRAVREWNRSRTDRRTESVVTIQPADGSPTTKTTVRTEPRIGSAACLGKALAAIQAMEGLHCRERARQERLSSDAAGKEDGLTRTVKTTLTPSGREVRTVVTTRSDDGGLAALRDAQEALDEKRDALEARLEAAEEATAADKELKAIEAGIDAAEEAGDEAACAALKAQAAVAEEKFLVAVARLEAAVGAAPARSPAIAADEEGGVKCPLVVPPSGGIPPKGGTTSASADTGSARLANGGTAGMPRNRRKSFSAKDLPLPGCDFASVPRSPTFPNEVLQKRGAGTSNTGGASHADATGGDAQALANASGSQGAGLANAAPAKKPRDWRKSFVPKDLHLRLDELFSDSRSATLPNEVLQKRGRRKTRGQRSEGGGRR